MKTRTIFEWAEEFCEQMHGGASESDIVQLLEDYKAEQLRIHNVSGSFFSEKLKEAYNDGFGDSTYDFDSENYR